MDLVGKVIGPYKVVEEIGKGGMGIVFKGIHEKLGRTVAIKMLAPHLSSDPEMRARFLKEAKLQAELSHPNVVNIFDYIEEKDRVFLVMEYVSGQTLEKMLLQRGRLTPEEVLYIAEGVLQALAFMHKKGVIHRDIKPSNIMISESGVVKVTDFGIARLIQGGGGLTRVGTRVGTLYYMAPELLKEGKISPSVDIYALGVTLYQLLTGRVPFTGSTDYEIIYGHLEKVPPSISELVDGIPKPLEALVNKAIAKNPAHRFQKAEEFLEEIKTLRNSGALAKASDSEIRKRFKISLPTPSAFSFSEIIANFSQFFANRRMILVGGTLLLIVSLILIIWVLIHNLKSHTPHPIPLSQKERTSPSLEGGFKDRAELTPGVTTLDKGKLHTSPSSLPEDFKKELLEERGTPSTHKVERSLAKKAKQEKKISKKQKKVNRKIGKSKAQKKTTVEGGKGWFIRK